MLKKKNTKILGNKGEDIAAKFLEEKNYEIIDRNFSCKQGEIDIIAKKEKEYIFCEVKTRKNKKYGDPIDAVNFVKQERIWNATKYYLYKKGLCNEKIRFDVIEIYYSNNKRYIHHIKNVDM